MKVTHLKAGAHSCQGRLTDGDMVISSDGKTLSRPGMLVATLAQCPRFGGRLSAVDERPALAVPGVRRVVKLDTAVAVVADGYWAARAGLEALTPTWTALSRNSETPMARTRERFSMRATPQSSRGARPDRRTFRPR